MASIIAAWPMVRFDQLLTRVERKIQLDDGDSYKCAGVRWYGNGAFNRETLLGMQIKRKQQWILRTGDVVYNKLFAWKGAFAIASTDVDGCIVSDKFPTYAIDTSLLDARYLGYFFRTPQLAQHAMNLSKGAAAISKLTLNPPQFWDLTIPLPPLDEQRRIVARIESLAARIAEARGLRREALAEAEALWRSALLSAFKQQDEGGVTGEIAAALLDQQKAKYAGAERSNYNGAHPWEPNVYRDGLYAIPPSWVWTDLGSVLTLFVDCVNDTPDFSLIATDYLGLKSTNIRPYRLDLGERWFVTEADYSRWNRRATPLPGDLILTREAPMGNVCALPEGVAACLTQRLMLLRSDTEFVDMRYLLHYLNSPHFQSQVLEQCRGLTTPHIRVKDAPFLKVPLPPRRTQEEIVAFLDGVQMQIDDLKKRQASSAAELDALLPSILDQAFRGEL